MEEIVKLVTRVGLTSLLVLFVGIGDPRSAMARDEIELPPIQRRLASANGEFELEITRPERLAPDRFPQAVLFRTVPDGERTKVWNRALNIYIGPRFVVVSNTGIVVFFDEWLRKVDTEYAVQVLGLDGSPCKSYALEEIMTISGRKWSEISEVAKYGAWISTEPVLLDSDHIRFEIGGSPLVLRIGEAVIEMQGD